MVAAHYQRCEVLKTTIRNAPRAGNYIAPTVIRSYQNLSTAAAVWDPHQSTLTWKTPNHLYACKITRLTGLAVCISQVQFPAFPFLCFCNLYIQVHPGPYIAILFLDTIVSHNFASFLAFAAVRHTPNTHCSGDSIHSVLASGGRRAKGSCLCALR